MPGRGAQAKATDVPGGAAAPAAREHGHRRHVLTQVKHQAFRWAVHQLHQAPPGHALGGLLDSPGGVRFDEGVEPITKRPAPALHQAHRRGSPPRDLPGERKARRARAAARGTARRSAVVLPLRRGDALAAGEVLAPLPPFTFAEPLSENLELLARDSTGASLLRLQPGPRSCRVRPSLPTPAGAAPWRRVMLRTPERGFSITTHEPVERQLGAGGHEGQGGLAPRGTKTRPSAHLRRRGSPRASG